MSSDLIKKAKYEGGKFERFCEQQVDWSFNVINIPAAALDKFLGKYFKMSANKMAAYTNQTVFQACKKA